MVLPDAEAETSVPVVPVRVDVEVVVLFRQQRLLGLTRRHRVLGFPDHHTNLARGDGLVVRIEVDPDFCVRQAVGLIERPAEAHGMELPAGIPGDGIHLDLHCLAAAIGRELEVAVVYLDQLVVRHIVREGPVAAGEAVVIIPYLRTMPNPSVLVLIRQFGSLHLGHSPGYPVGVGGVSRKDGGCGYRGREAVGIVADGQRDICVSHGVTSFAYWIGSNGRQMRVTAVTIAEPITIMDQWSAGAIDCADHGFRIRSVAGPNMIPLRFCCSDAYI